jgi:hypothetical protein
MDRRPLGRGGAGPCWVRTASGTAGSGWTRAVTTGKTNPQLRRHSRPRPGLLQHGGGGFEPLGPRGRTVVGGDMVVEEWRIERALPSAGRGLIKMRAG